MNVYDFDKTIYNGDSTLDFYFFMLKKYPSSVFLLPKQISGFLKYKKDKISKTHFKEIFFSFLKKSSDINRDVTEFWDKNEHKIKDWYLRQQKHDDIIISASPEFLLNEICRRISIENLIASEVEPETGVFLSENCYGKIKTERLKNSFPDAEIKEFYSDSRSDEPMAKLAQRAFLVKNNDIKKW